MKVSLIMTCLNERKGVEDFIAGVRDQVRQPDEIIVVDGGSDDGTVGRLVEWSKGKFQTKIVVDYRCHIRHSPSPVAKGRNVAIGMATGDIICVTDAGCKMNSHWLKWLVQPIEEGRTEVTAGRVKPSADTPKMAAFGAVMVPLSSEPASRSVAFTKNAWLKVGGYPEIALTAEDTLFNERLKGAGYTVIVTSGWVEWTPPSSWKAFARQIFRYAKGDGICGTHRKMYRDKLVKWAFPPLAIVVNATKPHPLAQTVADGARIAGYLKGRYAGW